VTLIQRAMARACWDLTLHQSPALAICTDCNEVEHARTHEVPHDMVCHVTSMHAGQHVTVVPALQLLSGSTAHRDHWL
jgi:hypothetical protein